MDLPRPASGAEALGSEAARPEANTATGDIGVIVELEVDETRPAVTGRLALSAGNAYGERATA
ncbi:hypothetical protein ACWDYH_12930 [Nocardia goodfellowii]